MKKAVFEASLSELQEWFRSRGEPAYRAQQVRQWAIRQRAVTFSEMSNIPLKLRENLDGDWSVLGAKIACNALDPDGTLKLVLKLRDERSIECVVMFEDDRRTACISTQVGCGMGCVFCASGLNGVERNLTMGEMVEQLLHLQTWLARNERLTNIVVMGMGEPLANLDALLPALDFANSAKGLGIGARNITISTVGLPAKIRDLADAQRAYHLAVSLHAPNDALRAKIVPTAQRIRLMDILAAADYFRQKTSRQVTFEYVLLGGRNDEPEHASELAKLVGKRDSFVNLIPYNPVAGLGYESPTPERTNQFASILREAGLVVKIRKRKGASINAACGQLRRTVEPPLVRLD